MNHESIQNLIDELIAIDPQFKQHAAQLHTVLAELSAKKPNIILDDAFVATLRKRLVGEPSVVAPRVAWWSFFLKPMVFSGVGAAVVIVALSVSLMRGNNGSFTALDLSQQNGQVVSVAARAFGMLSGESAASKEAATAPSSISSDQAVSFVSREAAGFGGGSAMPSPLIYPMERFVYEYVGDTLPSPSDELPVYKRVPLAVDTSGVVNAIANAFTSLLKLTNFSGLGVQQIQLVSNVDSGYMISLDLLESRAQIHPYYEKWYMMRDVSQPVQEQELPSDDDAVRLATEFLDKHGIDVSRYGSPVVDGAWKDAAPYAGSIRYVPDAVGVIFPIAPEGQQVVDYGGQLHGLRVNVDARTKRVQGVWNISAERYERSNYPMETDGARILDVIMKQYNQAQYYPKDTAINTVTLSLGTPEQVYMLQSRYDEAARRSEELYVPAWRFPVTSSNTSQYHSKYLIVPLTKEYIDQQGKQPDMPVQIMDTVPVAEPVPEIKKQ